MYTIDSEQLSKKWKNGSRESRGPLKRILALTVMTSEWKKDVSLRSFTRYTDNILNGK